MKYAFQFLALFSLLHCAILPASYISNGGGGGGGVSTVGTFSGSSQTNGANISGSTITFGPADTSNPGMLAISGTQTLGVSLTMPTISLNGGGNVSLSGGTNTNFTRAHAAVKITDADTYLSHPGIDFYGGSSGVLAMEIDDSQLVVSANQIFFPDNTYTIGGGGFRPSTITAGGNITSGGFFIGTSGFIITGITRTTATTTQTLGANTAGILLDPATTTSSQTVNLPSAANSANGLFIKIICGANGVTALTVGAGTSNSISMGTNPVSCIGKGFQFYYVSATSTWYQMN